MRGRRKSAIAAFAGVASVTIGFAGCGALIGLDGIDHVDCVGSECGTKATLLDESGIEGSAEGSGPGRDGGEDIGPIPMPDATTLGDGATCNPFVCPNNSDLCDWFDGNKLGSWTSVPSSAAKDTIDFPLTPCGGPSSVRLDVPPASSAMYREALSSNKFTLAVDALPRISSWNKLGRVVLVSVSFVEACGGGQGNAEITLEARSDGLWLQACPGDGCSATCAQKKLGVLPATDTWQHITFTDDLTGGGTALTATFGTLTNTLSVGALGNPIQPTLRMGAQTIDTSGQFSVSYDDVALDLK